MSMVSGSNDLPCKKAPIGMTTVPRADAARPS
jgi:hypothetical protein